MRSAAALSAEEARWLAIQAQGLGRPRRAARVGRPHLRSAIGTIGVLQLDAINVVERSQFLVLFSRLGPYDTVRLHELTGPGGELFEYWGHAASLLPMTAHPLFRWRMDRSAGGLFGGPGYAARRDAWYAAHAGYIASILDEVHARGPITAGELSDPRRRDGEWWDRRSVGRQALEWLFAEGRVAGWRNRNFERVYDLPERVIPQHVLEQATPPVEDAHRQLVMLAANALGVATVGDLANYYHLKSQVVRARVAELVESGQLVRVSVEDWREPAFCLPNARPRRPNRDHATLLSPFDSLIWQRERTRRLFGFDYHIEVYVPASDRRYGYYVMPLLLGDELVARLDLKADRKASTLRVLGAFGEATRGGSSAAVAVAAAAAAELAALQGWMGLTDVVVAPGGDLAPALAKAVRRPRTRSVTSRVPGF